MLFYKAIVIIALLYNIEEKQQEIDNRIETVKKAVDGIENDIYEDDEAYEFEIVCPYCNHEFVADINSEENAEASQDNVSDK